MIRPALEPEKKPNIESPAKEISKEIVDKKLVDAAHRRQVRVIGNFSKHLIFNYYFEIINYTNSYKL